MATMACAQSAPVTRKNLAGILGFERPGSGSLPGGWTGYPPGTVQRESSVVHSGHWAVRLDRTHQPGGGLSALTAAIPIDFGGKTIELRGWLKTRNVSGFAGLWIREDAGQSAVEMDNMQNRRLHGTNGWREFSVSVPVAGNADRLLFGALLSGTGVAWVDGLRLLVDGKPVADAPPPTRSPSSGIPVATLTPLQIDNLSLLARVWGFLKYYDPAVTSGHYDWDAELLRVMPAVLSAPGAAASHAAISRWIDSLGPIEPCTHCATLSATGLVVHPSLAWIHDTRLLGPSLSHQLEIVYKNRVPGQQYYVALAPQVRNPVFLHEKSYVSIRFPDAGYQLLGLFRLWNIVEYWAPDRQDVGENWPDVLRAFIPQAAEARSWNAWTLVMMRFIAEIHDTHANLWTSLALRPPTGFCRLPVNLRFIGVDPVVSGYTSQKTGPTSGLQPGDVIQAIGGVSVQQLVHRWAPFYADSNRAAQRRDMARTLTNGRCGPVRLALRRHAKTIALTARRLPIADAGRAARKQDRPGPAFQMLSPQIAYLKLSNVKAADVAHYMERAQGTKGLIIDLRNYPSQFVVYALGSLLVRKTTPFAQFTIASLSNPGAFYRGPLYSLSPGQPHYSGKVVVLVDAFTQSQAEYTTMALQADPRTVVLGSTTAGADGNVSPIPLPGGLRTMLSGLGVFYPDGTPTQRIGVRINIHVHPTVAGLAAGRDQLLEAAIRQIDPSLTASMAEKIASEPAPPPLHEN